MNIVRPIGQRKSPKSFCAVGPDRANSDIHGRYDIHDIHGRYDIHGLYGNLIFPPGPPSPDGMPSGMTIEELAWRRIS